MARVVAIHGINNTYAGPHLMADEWVPALLDGLDLAGGPGLLTGDDIGCVFYGDVFRRPGRTLGVDDVEALAADDLEPGAETQVLAAWWQEASRVDLGVVPPGARTLGGVSGVQAGLAALAGSKFLAGASEKVLILWLAQVRAYFTRPQVREQVRQRLADAISSTPAQRVPGTRDTGLGFLLVWRGSALRLTAAELILVSVGG